MAVQQPGAGGKRRRRSPRGVRLCDGERPANLNTFDNSVSKLGQARPGLGLAHRWTISDYSCRKKAKAKSGLAYPPCISRVPVWAGQKSTCQKGQNSCVYQTMPRACGTNIPRGAGKPGAERRFRFHFCGLGSWPPFGSVPVCLIQVRSITSSRYSIPAPNNQMSDIVVRPTNGTGVDWRRGGARVGYL